MAARVHPRGHRGRSLPRGSWHSSVRCRTASLARISDTDPFSPSAYAARRPARSPPSRSARREEITEEPSAEVTVAPRPRRRAGPTILRSVSGGYSNPRPTVGQESRGRPHSLAPKGELPMRSSVRLVQGNYQASSTSTVAAGARLRLNRVRGHARLMASLVPPSCPAGRALSFTQGAHLPRSRSDGGRKSCHSARRIAW